MVDTPTTTRLEELMAKSRKLDEAIAEERAKGEASKVLQGIGADVAGFIQGASVKAGIEVKSLNGKFFALTVAEDGKLSVDLVAKANGHNGNGKAKAKASTTTTEPTASTNGNGSEYEYFLADGNGPFATIQEAMDKTGIDKAQRPRHERYDRLSKAWQEKVIQKAKVVAETPAS